ncbi:MAG: DUF4397 domain-containing protein [Myxococcales bacterium]|nr:DUF4397 domain-containing protein [Deltaproteobacteria bacterium]NND29811.1 DUF4397 domain-containing protein [Myxococcales bacterium]MBT8481112.1 DUF4397 domain-containing protein [Deltaproteobacteria bacterium]NNK09503.1 DUF4397 domain-containing protein [Myxococcales bacterium]NNK44722.1 DUF4397 domain-containing protein [Myxococcales bacterium]
MKNYKSLLGIVAAVALAAAGCGDDATPPPGGTGGNGGTGGMPATGNVTAVHLAPEVPSAEDTAVALFVNGTEATALGTLEYSQSTGKIALEVGTYDIGIGVSGDTDPLLSVDGVMVTEETDLVVVAYRTNAELPVNVFVFDNSTEGLEAGSGRVLVAHGANDPALDPVNISLGEDPDCQTLIPALAFEEQVDGADALDLAEGTYKLGFDVTLDDESACADVGPVDVPVTVDVVSILVAVDENTSNDADQLNPELWAIIPDAAAPNNQPIRTIQPTP